MKVIVLDGGISPERAVSLRSGARIVRALRTCGMLVSEIDWQEELSCTLLAECAAADAVFLALHGGDGENGVLQAFLDKGGVHHYTGSDASGAEIATDKPRAKAAVSAFGVPVAKGCVTSVRDQAPPLAYPFVAKPRTGGSSLGFSVIRDQKDWESRQEGELLCETYLPGREFTVGILAGQALPVVEIRPVGGVYDYEHKYRVGGAEELCPAPIDEKKAERLARYAVTAFHVLGLRDSARLDFREDATGEPCFLEANVLPGMTETSLFPLAAKTENIPFDALCLAMAEMAAKRKDR